MNRAEDPRIIKTKRDLKKALIELLDERSLNDVKVQDLCKKALVNKTTFYRHYHDLYDIYGDLLDDMFCDSLNSFKEYELFFSDPGRFMRKLKEAQTDSVKLYQKEMRENPVDLFSGLYEKRMKEKIYSAGVINKSDLNEAKLDIILKSMLEISTSSHRLSESLKEELFEKIVFSLFPKATK